jgi:hypothetical protein
MSSANGVAEMIVIEKGYPESFAQRLIDIDSWKTKYKTNKCFGLRLGLWYLAPLSTKFQLHRDGQFNGGRNQCARRKSPTCRKSLLEEEEDRDRMVVGLTTTYVISVYHL